MSPPSPVWRFVLNAFLWLPPCFAAWYLIAPYHASVAGTGARILVAVLAPGVVETIERNGESLAFVTTLEVHPEPGQTAVLLPEVDPLIYTYGLALFVAMMLATGWRWRAILAGAAMLLPFQAWGIAFDFLAHVGLGLGPAIAAQAGIAGGKREVIALGYQLGTLMFPTLAPVVVWAALNRSFIEDAFGASFAPRAPADLPGKANAISGPEARPRA